MSIRYALLALLDKSSMYGYQLRAQFESSTGATWPLNIGQVYSTLQRLERDRLVEASLEVDVVSPGDDRKRYALTEAGRQDLEQWFSTPVARQASARSELVIKVIMASMLPWVDARAVIDAQRAACMQALQIYTRAKAATSGNLAASLVMDSVIFAAESEIRWLDHCDARLAAVESEREPV
jgi:DNA-binding PadR family transcriptional regulator